MVRWLLEKGKASRREKDKAGNSPLLMSAISGHAHLVEWLLDNEYADIEERNAAGDSALTLAAYYGRLPVVRLLIEKYRVSAKKQDGRIYSVRSSLRE